ncbi:MAG: hypothetical protein IJB43_01485 [Clostridia bacterium]|nr:hypothetical protein [Clostridia bacterium]
MKLKRWLLPPATIVFGIALFLLFGLMLSLIESITAEAIITVIISNLCLIFPAIFSFFYGFNCLADANCKLPFILYNAFLFAAPVALSVFLTHNAFSMILSPILFVVCLILGTLGVFISKKSEKQPEYTLQFNGVSMTEPKSN